MSLFIPTVLNTSLKNNGCRIVAVSGGIGCGKSVVCRMLAAMGHEVYDCDSRARRIMDCSGEIKSVIKNHICSGAINPDGSINREALSEVVFANPDALAALNSAVHKCVREDILRESMGRNLMFVETAILYQSGLDRVVDSVWEVTAPEFLRVARVMNRNSLSRRQVEARINAQALPEDIDIHPRTCKILNDDDTAVLPQLLALLQDELKFVGIHPRPEF